MTVPGRAGRVRRVLSGGALGLALVLGPPQALRFLAWVGDALAARTPWSPTQATVGLSLAAVGLLGVGTLVLSELRLTSTSPAATEIRPAARGGEGPAPPVAEPSSRRSSQLSMGVLDRVPIGLLGELTVYLMVMLRMIWPVTKHLTTRFVGAGDAEPWMWQGWATAELVRHGDLTPWHLPDVVHPYGADLLLGDGLLPMAVGTVWNLIVGNPILAYNLTLLSAIGTAMWAARALAREITDHRPTLIVCAVAYASAPLLYLRLFGHLNLVFSFVVPLVVREAVRWQRGRGPLRPGRVGLLLFVSFLSSFYFLLGGLIALVVVVAVEELRRRDRRSAMQTGRVMATALAVCLALMAPLLAMRFQHDAAERSAGAPAPSIAEAARYGADGHAVYTRPGTSTAPLPWDDLLGRPEVNLLESTTFPGYLLLTGLIGLALLRSSLRAPLLAAVGVLWLASLGPALRIGGQWSLTDTDRAPAYWLPFTLARGLPGLGAMRAPNRLAFAIAALAVVGLALVLSRVATERRPVRITAFVAAALLITTNFQTLPYWSDDGTSPATKAALEEVRKLAEPGDTVLVVPADCQRNVAAVKLQIVHRTPEIGCPTFNAAIAWYSGMELYRSRAYGAWRCWPQRVGSRPLQMAPDLLPTADDITQVGQELGVRFFIYYKAFPCDDRGRNEVFIELLRSETHVLGEDERWVIFDANRRPDGSTRTQP